MKRVEEQKIKKIRKEQVLKDKHGITLIALVVTIVVLLILAGVSIAMLTGENGILTQANNAKEANEIAGALEKVQVEVAGSYGMNGNLDLENLNENLKNIDGIKTDYINDLPAVVSVDGYYIEIDENGDVHLKKRMGIEIGDYVNYTYDNAENYILSEQMTGSNENLETGVVQEKDIKWKVLRIHKDGTIDLISDNRVGEAIHLKGALGYNNGVFLLNDIAKRQYSNESKGIIARSINQEDIEEQFSIDGIKAKNNYTSSGLKYGDTKTYIDKSNYYPNLYLYEKGAGINTTETNENGIGVSESYYNDFTNETYSVADKGGLTITQTFYGWENMPTSYIKNEKVYEILFQNNYWIASRYATKMGINVHFGIRRTGKNGFYGNLLINSDGISSSDVANYLRPVVSIPANIEVKKCNGENSADNMHEII